MLCLIYTHSPSGAARPRASCVYIRQSTLACVITITYQTAYKIYKSIKYHTAQIFEGGNFDKSELGKV